MENFYSFDELSIPLEIKALFGGLYGLIVIYALWKTLISPPRNKRRIKVSGLIAIYFTVYAMFYCVNPDYFSYRDWMVVIFDEESLPLWNKEMLYAYIIMFCQWVDIYPFELFRLIVWGGGLLVVSFLAKMYRSLLTPGLVILFLFVFYSGTFSYARSSLGMAVYFLGVGIILWGKNFFVKMLGIGVAVCSYFCHHEMIIGIGVLPSLLFPFEKKKTIILALIMLGMMMVVINYVNSHLALMESLMGSDDIAEKMETYNERGEGVFRLSTSFNYLNFYFAFFLITRFFYKHKRIPKAIAGIFRITFVLLTAAIAFFVVAGSRSTYTYRVMYITIIPMSILIAYCYQRGAFNKFLFIIMIMFAAVTNCMRLINAM